MILQREYCDRCGKLCGAHDCNHGFHLFRRFVLANSLDYDRPMDLCQECYDSLAEWMKGGKVDQEKENE